MNPNQFGNEQLQGGGGGGAPKSASSSAAASAGIQFGNFLGGEGGSLSPLAGIIIGAVSLVAFVTIILVAKK